MKKTISKLEAHDKLNDFFKKDAFSSDEMKKIKRFAMKHKIKLKGHRMLFCKKCLYKLKGKTRVTKTHKTIICEKCGHKNRFKIIYIR